MAKNLILSGIKSLTIVDDCKITEEDVASQYTLTLSDIGKNVSFILRLQLYIYYCFIFNVNIA